MLAGPHSQTARTDAAKLRAILPGVPLVESPFFEEIAPSCGFDAETARIARELNERGFAVLRFPEADFEERAERIKRNLAPRLDFETWRATGWKRHVDLRIQEAWTFDKDVYSIAVNAQILEILSAIYGRKAWPFQTLNFPVGSQQHYHSDSVHFSSIPERFMCGVWVALEDVTEDSGPLEYYPGSHKWPILYNDRIGVRIGSAGRKPNQLIYHDVWEAIIEKHGIAPEYFLPRKGDALIWAANLLHGGSQQRNPDATRWSQVTHYFFKDCCYWTPMHSDAFVGKKAIRDLVDISTGKIVPNIYVDTELSKIDMFYLFRRWARTAKRHVNRQVQRFFS